MNALIFTSTDAQTLVAAQRGKHRLGPVELTDGRWFLMADVLTEIPDGVFASGIAVPYTVEPFEDIAGLMPVVEELA